MLQKEYLSGKTIGIFFVYCLSRMFPRYEAFRARCILAAIDHNHHVTRQQAQLKTTREMRFHRKYNKSSGRWTVSKVKVDKDFSYVPELLTRVIDMRMSETGRIKDPTERHADHPARIAPTLAPVTPLPTDELLKKQRSRTGMAST